MGCVGGKAAHTPPAPQVIEMVPVTLIVDFLDNFQMHERFRLADALDPI